LSNFESDQSLAKDNGESTNDKSAAAPASHAPAGAEAASGTDATIDAVSAAAIDDSVHAAPASETADRKPPASSDKQPRSGAKARRRSYQQAND